MRVFLGLEPPDWLRADLGMQQYLLPLARRVEASDLHLTLVFCGETDDARLEEMHLALQELRAAAFDLHLAGFGLFGGRRPHSAWAGLRPSPELSALQARVAAIARGTGLDLPHSRFVPHVTLGRFPRLRLAEQMRLERAIAAGAGYSTGPWRADEIVLWQSELTQSGPRYHALARYAFADARRPPPGVS